MFSLQFSKSIVCAVLLAQLAAAAPAVSSASVETSSAAASASVSLVTASSSIVSGAVPTFTATSSVISTSVPTTIASSTIIASSGASTLASSSEVSTATSTYSAVPASETVPMAPEDPNDVLWAPDTTTTPQAVRGKLGASILGPQDTVLDKENPDLLAPPTTDSGSVMNAKWPFSLSHNRLQTGGWARQQNIGVMPIADEMASVNMRLEAGAVRELHWHKTGEWSYILKGYVQVTAVNPAGQNYVATIGPGDLWYFPAGVPHSLQATDEDPAGTEFLLVFDTGDFSEDSTFLLTDWLAHVPKSVLAKNFQTDISTFDKLPGDELYIFPAPLPGKDSDAPVSPQGTVSDPYTFALSQVKATQHSGGSVKIVDSHSFKVSTTIAAAEVTVEPGAMRELHWHPTQDEWSYYIEGTARVTLFASQGSARTFNYQPGDIGYVPGTFGHYVENIGNTTLKFLEVFRTDTFQDVSLSQWLALTPPEMVKATLNLDDEALTHLSRVKPVVIGPSPVSNNTSSN